MISEPALLGLARPMLKQMKNTKKIIRKSAKNIVTIRWINLSC